MEPFELALDGQKSIETYRSLETVIERAQVLACPASVLCPHHYRWGELRSWMAGAEAAIVW